MNVAKNALFFLLRSSTHHSFTFNLQFLYELKHMVHLSKTVCGIFHFGFCLVFIKLYIFGQQQTFKIKVLSMSLFLNSDFKVNIWHSFT